MLAKAIRRSAATAMRSSARPGAARCGLASYTAAGAIGNRANAGSPTLAAKPCRQQRTRLLRSKFCLAPAKPAIASDRLALHKAMQYVAQAAAQLVLRAAALRRP